MRVTIIPVDKAVYIDQDVVVFDYVLDADISTIHAVQWNGTTGHIEHIDENGMMIAVEKIESVEFAQHVIDEAVIKISEAKKAMAQVIQNPPVKPTVVGEPLIIR